MGAPEVLGIPAPAGVIVALSVGANTVVAASIILAVGLGISMTAMRIYGKRFAFISEFQSTIRSAFLPILTVFIMGIFLSLLMEYITPGHAFFFADRNPTELSALLHTLSYIARIVFLAGIALSAACIFIAIANHLRDGDERITVFVLRILCAAAFAAAFARISDILIAAANHPANPALSGIIVVGTFTAAATIGSAILGILRPRQLLWSLAATVFLLAGIAASSYVGIHFADEAYSATAPTFGAAYRIQPVLMTAFFVCTALALFAVGMTTRWWIADRNN